MNGNRNFRSAILYLIYFSIFTSLCVNAQGQAKAEAPRSIEDLNFLGGDAAMPPFSESVIDARSAFRQKLFDKGMALRLITQEQYAQNTLAAPVPSDEQAYVGQSPFAAQMEHLIFTWDLRQLKLKHAQFYGSGVWNWVSWRPAGPKAFDIWDIYLAKDFAAGRLSTKAGYISNGLEFVGLFVGGSTASGAQGVYAVLPYEVGMSYFPMATPAINATLHTTAHTYVKASVQRSLDAAGGPASIARNATVFRFIPHGDRAMLLAEGGYRRAAASQTAETWLRGGYTYNLTRYTDFQTGEKKPGNSVAYVLYDRQLKQTNEAAPYQGFYAGVTAMTASSQFNAFDRYYEARLYDDAPFRSRPADILTFVATYTGHSRYLTNNLLDQGKTEWRNGASMTGSYTIHAARGQFLSVGLSYLRGASITPRVDDALTFATSYTVFF